MKKNELNEHEVRLDSLIKKLKHLETAGVEEMRLKREMADMGDDYRENEGAKLVMEQEMLMYSQMGVLRWEIGQLRKKIIILKKK